MKELATTSGDSPGGGEGVEMSFLLPSSPWLLLQNSLILAPSLLWKLLTQVMKALGKSSQIFLKPLLISSIPECVLAKAETSVDPPELV